MSRPARLLMVSPMPSHPADQGNAARLRGFGAAMQARGIACDLCYYATEGIAPAQRAAMAAFWDRLEVVAPVPTGQTGLPGVWAIDDWCADALVDAVAALHADRAYDAVVVHYVWLSRVLDAVPDALRLIDTHDLFGDRHLAARAAGIDPSWFFTTRAEEGRGLARADIVLGIQDAESAELRRRGAGEVLTLGHLPPLRFLTEAAPGPARAPFGYFASANPWNLASARALDAALVAAGGMPWLIAGRILGRRDLVLASQPLRMPDVPDVEAFYDAVDCVLNPMQGGTGLKIKTVEALAQGRPVMGTRDAFTGLPARHAAHAAPDVTALVGLMRDYRAMTTFRAEVARESRRLALAYAAEVTAQQDALAARIRAAAR